MTLQLTQVQLGETNYGGRHTEVFDGKDKEYAEIFKKEAEIISDYVSKATERYVEIGIKHGGSLLLARASNPDIEIWGIDKSDEFYNLKHRQDINIIAKPSLEVVEEWDKPIDVLFIDGNHDEAKLDFEEWEKFIKKGGYVIFHDYDTKTGPKVVKDCNAIAEERKDYEVINSGETGWDKDFMLFIIKKL